MTKQTLRLDQFLPYRLSITSNLVSARIADAYEALFGLKIPEWRIIAVTAENKGITQLEIGERTRMDKVTVSRAAAALTARKLIDRRTNPADKRSQWLVLSAAGQSLYKAIAPKALELESQLFAGFNAGELASLTAMLKRIDAAALDLRTHGATAEWP